MDDKTITLLEHLRIDRTEDRQGSARRGSLLAGGVLLLLALAAGAWWTLSRPRVLAVQAAVARDVSGAAQTNSPMSATSTLDASGYVVARRAATVASKSIGRLAEVMIEEGQRVEAGQIIAKLDDSSARAALDQSRAQLAQAEATFEASKGALDDAKPIFKRNQQQMNAGVISAQAFDNARATYNASNADYSVRLRGVAVARAALSVAQRNLDDTIVRAPFGGVVTVKAAQAGEIVSPQSSGGFTRTGIGTIVDMDSLEVEVDVAENFINRVQAGQPTLVQLNAYPDWEIPSAVIAVIPTADRSKATVKVRIGFKQRDARILPEMGARVAFLRSSPAATPSTSAAAVTVPTDAVQISGKEGIVFIIEDDVVERRAVHLGRRTALEQTVLSGLSAGSRVVVGNLQALSDGAKVHVASWVAARTGGEP
jgi:RND family efflux transporter MFP subunit